MTASATALQLLRIPALLLLLWATTWPTAVEVQPIATVSTQDYRGAWALTSLLGLGFVVLVLAGRLRRHPWAVLAIEALVAGVLAAVPPIYWVLWWGLGGWWVTVMTGAFVQPLAITWLGVVGLRAFHQRRSAPEEVSPAGRSHARSTTRPSRQN